LSFYFIFLRQMFMPTSSFVTSKIGMAYILVCLLVLLDYCFVYLLNFLLVLLVALGLFVYFIFGFLFLVSFVYSILHVVVFVGFFFLFFCSLVKLLSCLWIFISCYKLCISTLKGIFQIFFASSWNLKSLSFEFIKTSSFVFKTRQTILCQFLFQINFC